ncbi:MAG: hypothetical protein K0R84_1542 [Clostridia bacterium]|jgi:type IV pilus assembly protein PilO|nr:hypothetical protein [Clostridia bacterium]
MKLTKREKILLVILGLCAVLALLYYAVITPQLSMVSKLEGKAQEYSQTLESIKSKASTENPVFKEYKILNAKAQGFMQGYYPSIIQESILIMLDSKIKESGIEVSTISFTEPAWVQLSQSKEEQPQQSNELKELAEQITGEAKAAPAAQNKESKENVLSTVENMTVSIAFQGTYNQFYSFLKAVEQENRSIVVSSVKLASNGSTAIEGEIILDFYAIPKPFEQDDEYLKWSIDGDYGKINPFGYIPGLRPSTASDGKEEQGSRDLVMRDFFITIRPITSDLPSVTMGKFDDKERTTYLYADNTGYEDVELQVLQDGDKYYYGYRTKDYSYPAGYSKDLIEFVPIGEELQVLVISTERNKEKDLNGVSLTVLNKTKQPLKLFVRDDDEGMPRLKINKLAGDVSIVKE